MADFVANFLELWGVAYLVDDIGWAIVYFKNKELLTKDESS